MARARRIAALLAVAAVALPAVPSAAARDRAKAAADGPPTVTPDDIRFDHRKLRPGKPGQVGLLPQYVAQMRDDAEAYLKPTPDHKNWPAYPGAVVLAAKDGVVVENDGVGRAVRYSSVGGAPDYTGVELPSDQQIPVRPDTVYDIASMSKLFTTIVVLQQVERGRVDLEAPVTRYLPEFAKGGKDKSDITVRMLLTHTSGLPGDPLTPLWKLPEPERLTAALTSPLDQGATPGGQYIYSDTGFITLAALVERVTHLSLAEAVRRGVTEPLRMKDTRYDPPVELRPRIAATEDERDPDRGMVWGEVHDENAWALGGAAGHAGVFSTGPDLAILCQTLLNGGEYRGVRILREATVREALVNYNARLKPSPGNARGLGFQLNTHSYMGPLASPVTFGHTGYTGTSVVLDPLSHSFLILLANRVHPSRNWGANTVARQTLARDLGYAMPVRPLDGGIAWRADRRDGGTRTLTASLSEPAAADARASFLLWYDTEPFSDIVRFESSTDDGKTWSKTPMTLSASSPDWKWTDNGQLAGYGGRRWWRVSADLPEGTTRIRWTYTTNNAAQGRGVYVDQIRGLHGTDVDDIVADGWSKASD